MKWKATGKPGIRYREHPTRKIGKVRKDRYYSIRYTIDGRQVETGIGWESEGIHLEDAIKAYEQFKRNAKLGEGGPVRMTEVRAMKKAEMERLAALRTTLRQFVETQYLEYCRTTKSAGMFKKESEHLRRWIIPHIGDIPLKAFERNPDPGIISGIGDGTKSGKDFAIELKNLMMEKLAPRSVEVVFQTMRQVLKHAVTKGVLESQIDFYDLKNGFRIDNARQRFLSKAEAEALLLVLRKYDETLADMAEFSLLTAARQSEVFGLQWADIDEGRKTALIRDPKSKTNRHLFLTDRALEIVRKQRSGNPAASDPVFRTKDGKAFGRLPYSWQRAINESGLNDGIEDRRLRVCWHTLRHTAASWLAEAGVDLYRIAKILGHSDVRMTQRYSHLKEEDLRTAIEKAMGGNHERY